MITRRDFLTHAAGALAAHAAVQTLAAETRQTQPAQSGNTDLGELILYNGRITTLNAAAPSASALAARGGTIVRVGSNADVLRDAPLASRKIDLRGRTLVPGLNDSHLHLIRGGLNYNLEVSWVGVRSLGEALERLRRQVARTQPPQWVRVVGGFTEYQFKERRLPTLDELNAVAPDTPVFILHLYDRALLNRAALRAVGYTKDTPEPPGGTIERDRNGNPTGLLVAKPNAYILYKTLSLGPKLAPDDQLNSTRHFMRELNRLGVTSCIDAGGGFQNYPDDYEIIQQLHRRGELTVRIAYNLFTQRPAQEFEDFKAWAKAVKPGDGDGFFRHNGAGEMLVFSAADFEDFLEPRPDLPATLEPELSRVVRFMAESRWPFRIHATYDESISRFLNVIEDVNRAVPLVGLRWLIDHAETISDRNIERIRALGGGIAVQHRMAFQGEYFVNRYGEAAARRTPPLRKIFEMGVPLGGGTDATRVASHNPWVSLWWLVTGRTLGGLALYPPENRLSRVEALRAWTSGSAWFSGEDDRKGMLAPGYFADVAVLSDDFFNVSDEKIAELESVLTIVDGKVVHGAGEFAMLAPPLPPASPDWSPVRDARTSSAVGVRESAALAASLGGCGCFAF